MLPFFIYNYSLSSLPDFYRISQINSGDLVHGIAGKCFHDIDSHLLMDTFDGSFDKTHY